MMKLTGIAIATVMSQAATAQKPPAVRQIGRLEHVTTDSLASVGTALALRDGRVLVNDRIGRRVLLFDSTLTHPTVVADTTAATASAYGNRIANLIWFRGDSALLIDQTSLSMSIIDPHGKIARVMAIPRAQDAQALGTRGCRRRWASRLLRRARGAARHHHAWPGRRDL